MTRTRSTVARRHCDECLCDAWNKVYTTEQKVEVKTKRSTTKGIERVGVDHEPVLVPDAAVVLISHTCCPKISQSLV